jgi:hypothetical protein
MRYVVTELEGYLNVTSMSVPGLSTHVVDTLQNRRVVKTWRSEEHNGGGRSRETVRDHVRKLAQDYADELNAGRS